MERKNRSKLLSGLFLAIILLAGCGSSSNDASRSGDDDTGQSEDASPNASYQLSGVITAPITAAVDGDVNDPDAPYTSNDDFDSAQNIANPVTLAGYVNQAGAGAEGRSYSAGDEVDIFSATMTAGEVIALYIADSQNADIDLRLYGSADQLLVDESVGDQSVESLTAPEDGTYYIEVIVVDGGRHGLYTSKGASNYTLVIGDDLSATNNATLRLSDDFVPGEVIVRFAEDTVVSRTDEWANQKATSFGMNFKGGAGGRPLLMGMTNDTQIDNVMQRMGISPPGPQSGISSAGDDHLNQKRNTLQIIKAFRKRSDIQYAEPNYIRKSCRLPNDAYFDLQWHYDLINLSEAWDVTTGNDNVVVAVVDTGVLMNHPDLAERLTSDGYDFISQTDLEGDEASDEKGGIDGNPDDPGDESVGGSTFHGTHVAGTIAAATNNGIGVSGIGWQAARIMPLRVLGVGGSGTSYDMIQAIYYAAGLSNDAGTIPDHNADIINLSLGGNSFSSSEQEAFTRVRNAGVVIVAAAGNDGSSQATYPAGYDGVVSVSAVDYSATIADYSSFGSTIDVAAPGGNSASDYDNDGYPDAILSTMGDDSSGEIEFVYGFAAGSSMAAPHVAGVIALMKSLWEDMTPSDVDSLLAAELITNDLGSTGRDNYYGYGLIDAQKAVAVAQEGTIPTQITINPSVLNFGSALTEVTFVIDKSGESSINPVVTDIASNVDWITITPVQIDDNGLGSYITSVTREGLADGSYTATITVASTENSVELIVKMLVGTTTSTANAGYHHVMLIDSASEETVDTISVDVDQGEYHFTFTNVAPGDYLIYAGTDLDSDNYIGDAGEVLGAYPNLDQPIVLSLEDDMVNLDFITEFSINLSENPLKLN